MRLIGKLGWKNGRGEGPDFEVRHIYDVLDVIERKPGLFVGEPSISALWWTLLGFDMALHAFSVEMEKEHPSFLGFHDYVAETYGFYESTAGWRNMILRHFDGDEKAAFVAFFDLLREYRLCHNL